jgi:putative photosynthetic complex assembly protein
MSTVSYHGAGKPEGHHVPRGILLGAGAMLLFVLAMVGVARLDGSQASRPEGPAVQMRLLSFEDHDDGSIAVLDAETGRVLAELAPGTNGFIRASMRGLARERRRADHGPETPFRLTRWADGRLTLEDPTNGRMVDLIAFGHTQVATFENFLGAPQGGAR